MKHELEYLNNLIIPLSIHGSSYFDGIEGHRNLCNYLGKDIPIDLVDTLLFGPKYHLMDLSTGTLREKVTLLSSGSELNPGQHDYDGIRNGIPIEVKPSLFTSGNSTKRINGKGSINDHNVNRHQRFIDSNMLMQQSQFINGQLAWIFEWNYSDPAFIAKMETAFTKSGRIRGEFSYKDFVQSPQLSVHYLNWSLISSHKNDIVGGSASNDNFFLFDVLFVIAQKLQKVPELINFNEKGIIIKRGKYNIPQWNKIEKHSSEIVSYVDYKIFANHQEMTK